MKLLPSAKRKFPQFKLEINSTLSFYMYSYTSARKYDIVIRKYPNVDHGVLSILDGRILGAYVDSRDPTKLTWFQNMDGTYLCKGYLSKYKT
mgnify:CR=1 FL=1